MAFDHDKNLGTAQVRLKHLAEDPTVEPGEPLEDSSGVVCAT